MVVEATAPTRIDLAGGTLDLYPLYLFMEGGVTDNAAIDLRSKVRIETRDDREVHLRSVDTKAELAASSVEALPVDQELSLVARVVRYYAPRTGVEVTTECTVPHGSGLGASSSLLMALTAALDRLNGTELDRYLFVEYGANLEAQVIGIPTGKQDYLAAVYGGVNAFHFKVEGWEQEALVADEERLRTLEERIVLTFTGESHFSGTNNWNMMKRYIDDSAGSRESMREIRQTAIEMRDALLEFDLERFGELLGREWESRTSKIQGAGGGGCMITLVEEGARAGVEAALEGAGAQVIRYGIAREGITTREL
jgi:D-glycero-alpha-D-manno-heptose-7-phosphate kinase